MLVLQNSALALVMHYTRTTGQERTLYIPTTAVVMAELLKILVALRMQYQVGIQRSFKLRKNVERLYHLNNIAIIILL